MNLKITNISKTNLNGIGALKNVMFNKLPMERMALSDPTAQASLR